MILKMKVIKEKTILQIVKQRKKYIKKRKGMKVTQIVYRQCFI